MGSSPTRLIKEFMMNKLCEIADKWGTDKASENGSGFCISYDEWFNHMIEKEPNILEIGVKAPRGEGNHPSLSVWQEYFQNGKQISGKILKVTQK